MNVRHIGEGFPAPPARVRGEAGAARIPDHELVRHIGSGSYGEVWLARNVLGTLRAVKVVWRESFDSDRPFEREFAGIQKFEPVSRSHEGLVDVLQIGRNAEAGYFYYVMELADDARTLAAASLVAPAEYQPRTLRSEIARAGHLPFEECLGIFLTLTSALGALHRQGLIHRDIKPSNIIIVAGVAKLADIGLVAAAGEARSFVGTEGFIPPEGPGTAQADLYSLGKVLYEAATGLDRLQFPSLPEMGEAELIASERLLELNALALRACATDPAQRYRSANEMHADLALLQSGRSVKRLRLLEQRVARARRIGLAAGLVALLAVVAALVVGYRARVEQANRQRTEALLHRAEAAERDAREKLAESLLARAPAERRSGRVGARFASLEAIAHAAELLPASARLRSEAITTLALADIHLRQRWRPLVRTFKPQVFSDDLRLAAQAETNGLVRIFRTADDSLVASLPAARQPVTWVGPFSPDATRLMLVPADGGESVWDIATARELLHLPPPAARRSRGFTRDGGRLGVNEPGGVLALYPLEGGAPRRLNFGMEVNFFEFSPDGRWAAGGHDDGNDLVVLEVATGSVSAKFTLPARVARWTFAWSADGRRLVVGGNDFKAYVWSLAEPAAPPLVLGGHTGTLQALALHPQGDLLVTGSWDFTTRLWSLPDGHQLAIDRGRSAELRFAPDGAQLGSYDNRTKELALYEVAAHRACRLLSDPPVEGISGPTSLAFSPDGQILATASQDGVRLCDTATGQLLALLPVHLANAVIFEPTGAALLVGSGSGLSRWPLRSGAPGEVQCGPAEPQGEGHFYHLSQSQAGGVLAAAFDNAPLRVFGPGRPALEIANTRGQMTATLSPDGRWLAAMHLTKGLRIWDARTGQLRHTLPQFHDGSVAFSPDSRWLCSASFDDICQWDADSGAQAWAVPNPEGIGRISTAVYAPDGRLVAARLNEFQVALLDAATGETLARIEHPDLLSFGVMTFSPDGSQLVCATGGRGVQVWDLRYVREQLARLKLDWPHPPLPPSAPAAARVRVRVVPGGS